MVRKQFLGGLALAVVFLAVLLSRLGSVGLPSAASEPLILEVIDQETEKDTPARFSLLVDGKPYFPASISKQGLRFVSIHEAKKQVLTVTYVRGTGPVEVPLPAGAREVTVRVAKGFEYFPEAIACRVGTSPVRVKVPLRRWINLAEKNWASADAHVHYDRLNRASNEDWLTMLAADGLDHGHFLVLKGGKVPGIWAQQYAYGKDGEAVAGQRWIRPGEEYRDSAQGHINLLGIREVIPPISTGGLGKPSVPYHYPPLHDVFLRCRRLGGLGGVAHGGSLGRTPTAIVDTVLGGVDFFEIANTHLYAVDLWYQLMNCGYHLPPAAGTDLPNYPFRDPWQPFLGSMRMVVKMGRGWDFESWKQAIQKGEIFITSGPVLSVSVDGKNPGEIVRLPARGGEVTIEASLASPVGLRSFELIHNGQVIPARVEKKTEGGVQRWHIRTRLRVTRSCWVAGRGEGVPIQALQGMNPRKVPWFNTDALAHSAAIRILVGDEPIRSPRDAQALVRVLQEQQEYYRTRGVYQEGENRLRVQELYDQAITELRKRFVRAGSVSDGPHPSRKR